MGFGELMFGIMGFAVLSIILLSVPWNKVTETFLSRMKEKSSGLTKADRDRLDKIEARQTKLEQQVYDYVQSSDQNAEFIRNHVGISGKFGSPQYEEQVQKVGQSSKSEQ